jgi:hypothetical protein
MILIENLSFNLAYRKGILNCVNLTNQFQLVLQECKRDNFRDECLRGKVFDQSSPHHDPDPFRNGDHAHRTNLHSPTVIQIQS